MTKEQRNNKLMKKYKKNKYIMESIFENNNYHPASLPRNFIWSRVGCGEEYSDLKYKKIEDLPIEFVKEFQHKIDWGFVGYGRHNYTKIEDLPIEFVREFQHKIQWKNVGSGNSYYYNTYNHTSADNLSDEFIKIFHNKNKYLLTEYLIRKQSRKSFENNTNFLPQELQDEISNVARFF